MHAVSIHPCFSISVDDGGYSVPKVKDLPKLHRAVWKCDMNKVKTATKGIKTNDLNAFDKGRRWGQ